MSKFGSLGVRIYGVAAVTAVAALVLGLLMLQGSSRSREALDWVNHTQEVIISLDAVENRLSQAESGLRGYLLTGEESYLADFDANVLEANAAARQLRQLVRDNRVQAIRARQIAVLAAEKGIAMADAAQRRRRDSLGTLPDAAERTRRRLLMTAVTQRADAMRREERRLLAVRTTEAQRKIATAKALLLYGYPLLVLLIGGIAWLIRASISRPLADLLDVVTRFGAGDREARATTVARSTEFKRLASAYNEMAEHLVTAIDTQNTRQQSIRVLSEMSQRLQAIQNEGELAEVLDCFIPQVLPDLAGALYLHNHSRNMLLRISDWGSPQASPEMFPPANCWGLRRGQTHSIENPGADLICAHAATSVLVERRCEPVLAGGDVLGLLYVEGHIADEHRFRLGMLMENIALALVNDNLRSRLREQSIRDPLTKLFNRRYMEEALALETARAAQSGQPLSIVMCDVDHFKRFNDSHGHEPGDLLLTAVAALIQAHFRQGDIVCRYGGEEFTVIVPGTPANRVRERVETLRLAVRSLTIDHQGYTLGPVTMSFGIDSWTGGDDRSLSALQGEADRALFHAKRLGRDRIEFSSHMGPREG